jgi:hypothetical protein
MLYYGSMFHADSITLDSICATLPMKKESITQGGQRAGIQLVEGHTALVHSCDGIDELLKADPLR